MAYPLRVECITWSSDLESNLIPTCKNQKKKGHTPINTFLVGVVILSEFKINEFKKFIKKYFNLKKLKNPELLDQCLHLSPRHVLHYISCISAVLLCRSDFILKLHFYAIANMPPHHSHHPPQHPSWSTLVSTTCHQFPPAPILSPPDTTSIWLSLQHCYLYYKM